MSANTDLGTDPLPNKQCSTFSLSLVVSYTDQYLSRSVFMEISIYRDHYLSRSLFRDRYWRSVSLDQCVVENVTDWNSETSPQISITDQYCRAVLQISWWCGDHDHRIHDQIAGHRINDRLPSWLTGELFVIAFLFFECISVAKFILSAFHCIVHCHTSLQCLEITTK